MSQRVLSDEVGVRFGLDAGLLLLLTAVVVAGRLPGGSGVGLLVGATVLLSGWLDGPHAVGLGVTGWAFATGFAVNTLGVLTVAPTDVARLSVFVLAAVLGSRVGGPG